jgi:hypothetical protein
MNNMMRSATNGTINTNATSIIKHYLKLHHEHHHEEPLVRKQNERKQNAKLHDEQITTMQTKIK